jgi:hypothetical protein
MIFLLDKYAIVSIFYVCVLCLWHSIVGALWTRDFAVKLDRIALIGFSIIFLLIHFYVAISFYRSHRKIVELKKKEREFSLNFGVDYFTGNKIRF